MNDSDETELGAQTLAVLFADIAGSTALYEEHGDAKARDATAACIKVMSEIVRKFNGRVVKTMGDEVMAVFRDAPLAIMASTDLHGAVQRAGEDGRFVTGVLRIKVGVHFGPGIEEADDVYGEATIVAQQIIALAKADQTLVSGAILNSVPPMLRMGSRFFERVTGEGTGEEIQVHELIWEVSGLTQIADTQPSAPRVGYACLRLNYQGQECVVDAHNSTVVMGRVAGNDLVVPTDLTSREHAKVEYKRGRFHLSDNSSNGTLVVSADGAFSSLRRESATLRGAGRICLGGTPESNPRGIVDFTCE